MRLLAVLIVLSATGFGQTCAPLSLLRPVDSVTGSLGDANCRLSDGSVFAAYTLTLPTFGQLQLNAASDSFPISLVLRDSVGRKVEGGSAIQKTIERGEYTVVVNTQGPGQAGKFTLNSAFQPEPNTICRSISRIGPNQSVDGHLLDSSCRLPDNTPYDGYEVSFLGSGTLEVTLTSTAFSSQVTLRGDDGRWAASDAKSFSLTVLGDSTYTIIAAGADPAARGDYKLTLKFTPADDDVCRPLKTLLGSEDVSGTIVADSCASGADVRFNYYTIEITAAGFVELRAVPGASVSTSLELLDSAGRLVAQDLQSGGVNRPIVRQQLSPGIYSVLVGANTKVDYTLQYRFSTGLPTTCPSLELRSGAQTGSFDGASSCRSISGMQDVYVFSTNSAGRVDVIFGSNDFDGSLTLRDAKDSVLVLGAARVVADLPAAGTYSLAVGSLAPGNYSLNYSFTAQTPGACPAAPQVPVNSRFRNSLSFGRPCRSADGQPVDYYEFATPSAGFLSIFMTSAAFDSYLTLTDSQGTVLRRDDDSFGFSDAMILGWLPGGTYRIAAAASGGLQTGLYQIDLLFSAGDRPAGCLPLGDLSPGTTQALLTVTSCQYVDDTFADIYRLPLAAATKLDITLTSANFDSYLLLLDEKGNVIDADDNSGGGGFNARLTSTIEAGIYYVVAKSFAGNGYVAGNYTLSVK